MRRKRTLEVGSGHRPHPSADVLLDRYLEPVEREGPLARDRPLVVGDAHRLPFGDLSFHKVLARQVLEHAEDPVAFVQEMGRVAPSVLIETPSPLTEAMFRVRTFHRWCVARDAHTLIVWPIEMVQKSAYHGELFESLYERNAFVYLLVRSRPDVFLTVWDGAAPPVRRGTQQELANTIECLHQQLCEGSRAAQLTRVHAAIRGIGEARLEEITVRIRKRFRRR